MRRAVAMLLAATATAVGVAAGPVAAFADTGAAAPATGADVSFPQCGSTPPSGQAFAVVGVNGGHANDTNPCLVDQLAWAGTASGAGTQPAVALYVNTANPGHQGAWWPTGDLAQRGALVPNPLGTCTGAEDAACAYVYGWSMAYDDATIRGIADPRAYTWWLDVETINTWSADRRANTASLEGMTDAFRSLGATVGLYSTKRQWDRIAGPTPASSSLAGLQSWLSGSVTADGAAARCTETGLTPGSRVAIAQYVQDLDHDIACGRLAADPVTVRGASTPGAELSVTGPRWPAGTRVSVQWRRDGHDLARATGTTYRTGAADTGHALAAVVSGVAPGYSPISALSAPVAGTRSRPAAPSASPAARPSTSTLPARPSPAPIATGVASGPVPPDPAAAPSADVVVRAPDRIPEPAATPPAAPLSAHHVGRF